MYVLIAVVGLTTNYVLNFIFIFIPVTVISDYSLLIAPIVCIVIGILVLIFAKKSKYKWVFLISILIGILVVTWFWWYIFSGIPNDWDTLD